MEKRFADSEAKTAQQQALNDFDAFAKAERPTQEALDLMVQLGKQFPPGNISPREYLSSLHLLAKSKLETSSAKDMKKVEENSKAKGQTVGQPGQPIVVKRPEKMDARMAVQMALRGERVEE